ncbi:MAG: CBS domain-containing protein [Melioribacteraceae bacterium]|nr:CBS domain-containing protein [Melioribacteraceae bacterium]
MTKEIKSAPHNSTLYSLLDIFLGKRFRHLLIQKEGEYIGILSMGDVIKANLNEKTKELKALNAIVSWEYYENWKFQKK